MLWVNEGQRGAEREASAQPEMKLPGIKTSPSPPGVRAVSTAWKVIYLKST